MFFPVLFIILNIRNNPNVPKLGIGEVKIWYHCIMQYSFVMQMRFKNSI